MGLTNLERKCFNRPIKPEDLAYYETQKQLLHAIRIFDNETLFDSMMITGSIEEIVRLCEQASNGNAFQSQPKYIYSKAIE
jgi:hypothetical protein